MPAVLTQYLDEIRAAAAAVEAARTNTTEATNTRDALIRIALRLDGLPATAIADAASIALSRLYQIRDGRR